MNEQREIKNSNEEILSRLCGKFSQTINSIVPTFMLDVKGDCLIQTGTRDIQKEIESHKECALDVMLDKFLDPIKNANVQYVDGITEVANIDLIDLADMSTNKEELAVKYGLDKTASLNEIYDAIKSVLTKQIEEVNENEKETK